MDVTACFIKQNTLQSAYANLQYRLRQCPYVTNYYEKWGSASEETKAVMTGQPRNATVSAGDEGATLTRISRDQFVDILGSNNAIARNLRELKKDSFMRTEQRRQSRNATRVTWCKFINADKSVYISCVCRFSVFQREKIFYIFILILIFLTATVLTRRKNIIIFWICIILK
mgnify:CR=1 FL=1